MQTCEACGREFTSSDVECIYCGYLNDKSWRPRRDPFGDDEVVDYATITDTDAPAAISATSVTPLDILTATEDGECPWCGRRGEFEDDGGRCNCGFSY